MSKACPINLPGISCAQGKLIIVGLGLGVALIVVLPILLRNSTARGLGGSLGSGAVDFVGGAIVDGTLSAGDVLGIPRTDQTQCEADLAAGRYWDASFSCPAGTFIKGIFS